MAYRLQCSPAECDEGSHPRSHVFRGPRCKCATKCLGAARSEMFQIDTSFCHWVFDLGVKHEGKGEMRKSIPTYALLLDITDSKFLHV